MEHNVFEEPVWIFVGLNIPREVATVGQAHAFLGDWPMRQRGPAHAVALKACRAALSGEIEAETARGAFREFARRAGILAPEIDDLVAARSLGKFSSRTSA